MIKIGVGLHLDADFVNFPDWRPTDNGICIAAVLTRPHIGFRLPQTDRDGLIRVRVCGVDGKEVGRARRPAEASQA